MSLMSKLLTTTLVATLALSANSEEAKDIPSNKALLLYVKKNVVRNPQVKVNGIEVLETKTDARIPGWKVLLTNMDLTYRGKDIKAPEMIFVKDGLATGQLSDLKTGKNFRDLIRPTVPASMYDDAHLLYGNKDAAHKIVVFSDPMCPFCRDTVPSLLKAAKEHPDQIALYYYHLPLMQIHPVSGILTKVMHHAQKEGKQDVIDKMYSIKLGFRETDMTKVLAKVKDHTGYSISATKVEDNATKAALKADEDAAARMMVSGTPTIYVDGQWDRSRVKYKKFIQDTKK